MLRAQDTPSDFQHLMVELLRLLVAALAPDRDGHTGHAPERVGMLRAQQTAPEFQGPLSMLLSYLEFAQ